MKALSTHSRQKLLSKTLERNGSRNQRRSLTRSFGLFEVQNCTDAIRCGCFIEGWTEHTAHATSSADGRAGLNTRPARPSTKLDQSSSADVRAALVQLGGWPSWIKHATSSADGRAGPVQFGGWPSWIEHATSSAICRARPVKFGGWPRWTEHATSPTICRAGTIVLSSSCPRSSLLRD
ncbi:hypothetical protein F2Q69_00028829 [Brassica cretica]|uniref:Uncharacterized protein n=1 Tax=Brassica cretica TaxID=69181 RepID=A0A8S9RVR5_BRACR|nr:hypothetical protein F2Q69_00028829 [Brassica cretica]